jgi:hypothetical protein
MAKLTRQQKITFVEARLWCEWSPDLLLGLQVQPSMKSFRRKDGKDRTPDPGRNGERGFHKEKRSNETHESTADPDARLYRKGDGQGARLSFMGITD